jgi:type IV secretory pathway TraG/TraD family ATPase VirD4
MLPHEVQQLLLPTKQIIFRPNSTPLTTGRVIYWRDRIFRGMEAPPPEVPLLDVRVERDAGAAAAPAAQDAWAPLP